MWAVGPRPGSDGSGPVVGAGRVHNKRGWVRGFGRSEKAAGTLLGFEATRLQVVLSPCLWWWGVVFELWIVVASIL